MIANIKDYNLEIIEDYNPNSQSDPSYKYDYEKILGNKDLLCNIAKQGNLSTLISIRRVNKNCLLASDKALTKLYNTLINSELFNKYFNEFSSKFKIVDVENSIIGNFLYTEKLKTPNGYQQIANFNGLRAVLNYKVITHIFFGHLAVNDIPVSVENFEKKIRQSLFSIRKCWFDGGLKDINNLNKNFPDHSDSEVNIKLFYYQNNFLEKMEKFIFNGLGLQAFPMPLCAMESKNEISLIDNKLEEFPVLHLTSLKALNLSTNLLRSIDVSYCPNLIKLSVCKNHLAQFPKGISKLKNLKVLNLSYNELTELPKDIAQLENLQEFYIAYNKLKRLPEEICSLNKLEILAFGKNMLRCLPDRIDQLKNLKELLIFPNPLDKFPNSICKLSKLEKLDIRHKGRDVSIEIPTEIYQLENLKELLIGGNGLEKFPNSICKLSKLEKLDISRNKLVEIPKEISQLKNLKYLKLDKNNLENIPDEICKLEDLEEIEFKVQNQISNINVKSKKLELKGDQAKLVSWLKKQENPK